MNVDFINDMPWHSFGRKNIGYLYAIANAAQVIWDFDDDNILKFWLKGATPDDALEIDSFVGNIEGNKRASRLKKISISLLFKCKNRFSRLLLG